MKLLIVEDELIIRKGIVTSVDWKKYGIEQIEDAKNGKKAMEIIPVFEPEIVITDIRMPVMDGLALTKELKANYPSTHIVILSGYQEFNYAQQALRLGVIEYLIKPVGMEELGQAISKIKNKIEHEKCIDLEQKKLNTVYKDNLQVIYRKWLNDLVSQEHNVTDKQIEYGVQIGVQFTGPAYLLFLVEIDAFSVMKEMMTDAEIEQFNFDVQNIISHVIPKSLSPILWNRSPKNVCVLVNVDNDSEDSDNDYGDRIRQTVKERLNYSLTIGKSPIINNVHEIPIAFRQAEKALQKKRYYGKDAVYSFEHVDMHNENGLGISEVEEETLFQEVKQLNFTNARSLLQHIFDRYSSEQLQLELVKNWCMKLIFHIKRDVSISSEIDTEKNLFSEIEKYDNLYDVKQFLEGKIIYVMKKVEDNRRSSINNVVSRAIKYIECHYEQQITLETLAKYSFVSTTYFSKIFKKETGKTFVRWLNMYRINKAKELFKSQPAIPVYKVAEAVGYQDYKYFVRVFKRNVGLTPKEYKNTVFS